MTKRAVPTAVLLAALALVALLVYGVASKGTDKTLDDAVRRGERPAAPDAGRRLPVLGDDARSRALADYRGKVVVLNFWASWCDPCREEAPVLRRAQAALARGGRGTVLGATYNDTPGRSTAFARRYDLTFPMVRDVGTRLAQAYGTRNLPETFVIDRRGRVVAVSRGVVSQAFLDRAIAKAEGTA